MSIKHICILGGTGFVGRHLIARLMTSGKKLKVLTRHRERHRELLVFPNLELVEADIHDSEQLNIQLKNTDAVINLVGILNEQGHSGSGFRDVHVELTRKMLDTCKNNDIRRIIHISALKADAANAPSFYLRTKGEAENHLHTFSGPRINVTSFSPSIIFGPDDDFFNRFARLLKQIPFIFPLAQANAKFAPVYVHEVASSIVRALEDKNTYDQRIELCGPEVFTLKELVEFTADCLKIKRKIIGLPNFIAQIQAFFMEYLLPGKLFTLDNYRSLQVDNIGEKCDPTLTSIKSIVPTYLGSQNLQSRYNQYRQSAHRR